MNEEIKEILDKLRTGFCSTLSYEKLLDYITNLQEENENLKNIISSVKEDFLNANSEAIDYKSRIEKAVEYIKEHSSNGEQFMEWFECTELLNILNGRSDE